MPASYTHYRFGAQILPLLPVALHARIDSHRSLFDLGLLGPDLFFSHNPLTKNPLGQTGQAMHNEPGLSVFHRFSALDDGSNAAFAYLSGFLCHFALDSMCRSYVEEITAMGVNPTLVRTQLDRAYLQEDGRDPLTANLAAHIQPKSQNIRVISRFFPQITENQVERALKDLVFCHGLLSTGKKPKRALLNTAFRIANLQDSFGAMVMQEQASSACEQIVARLQALYTEAVPLAVELISRYPDLTHPQYDYDFNGALHPRALSQASAGEDETE